MLFLREVLHAFVHCIAEIVARVLGAERDEVVHYAHRFVTCQEIADVEWIA